MGPDREDAINAVNAWRRRAVQMERERNQAQRERDRLLTALRKVKQLIDNTLERYDHAD